MRSAQEGGSGAGLSIVGLVPGMGAITVDRAAHFLRKGPCAAGRRVAV